MHLRYIKILFAVLTALMALVYVIQNVANVEAAHQSILYVMSGADHQAYPDSAFPKFGQPGMAWAALVVIFALELATGLALAKGSWDMWRNRAADAAAFTAAKKWAQIGAALGVLVWFGLFGVIGAAFFQMWQTAIGTGSMNGAFQFFVSCALALLVISQPEPAAG